MSSSIIPIDLSTAVVGTKLGPFDISQQYIRPTIEQEYNQLTNHIVFFNESGVGFQLKFGGGAELEIPAGGWTQPLAIYDPDTTFTILPRYIIANAPVTKLLGTVYAPYEKPEQATVLGNSPIGLAGAVPTSVTQVIQDGQPNGQTIVEATPTGQPQNVLLTTDGKMVLAGQVTAQQYVSGTNGFFRAVVDSSSFNVTTLRMGPDAHSLSDWMLISLSSGDIVLWDNKNGRNVWISRLTTGNFEAAQAIGAIGGQATAGSFGVPVIVAQALRTSVAVTGNQNILTFTPSANGFYRVSGYIKWSNGSNSAVVASVTWTDPDTGATNQFLSTNATGSTTPLLLSGSNTLLAGSVDLPLQPVLLNAASSGNMVCKWNDPSGTPNDVVTYIIERLA